MVYQIFDCNFKNIFDTYPQGILDIIHDVIADNFPELILDNYPQLLFDHYPEELLAYPKELLKSYEFQFYFRQKFGNEFITKDGKKFISDVPFGTFEDFIISLEFQSYDMDYDRKTIFNMYQASLHNEYHKHVITVVFSMVQDNHEIITHKINPYDGFTILIISLKALNQEQTLNNILYKIKNNISMSDMEKALFLLSPMMDLDNKIEVLNEIICSFNEINNLSEKEREDMKNILLLFVEKWCCNGDIYGNGGNDMVVLTPSAQKLKDKWIEEGKRSIVSNILANNISFEETSRLTGLSIEEISEIANSE